MGRDDRLTAGPDLRSWSEQARPRDRSALLAEQITTGKQADAPA
jgi:hypothetical protein